MRNSRDHLGARFEVWTGESTWFWHVFNPHNNGGAVGVAANAAEAPIIASASPAARAAATRSARRL